MTLSESFQWKQHHQIIKKKKRAVIELSVTKLNPINFDKKELEIVRRNQEMTSGQKEVAARVNASIICEEVRLIDADGNMVGIVTPEKANTMAIESGLDLVEISPNAKPPSLQDYGLW